ncbi:YidC/Oxa1 family membrane protein insertase [Anaerobacterium chartisolvens]|uniref:YidC/Oxa1 family membrane protein insertase n=1 Tax=Anaerobacterium chartisolvens TaxID=1297424 RepID=A0A369B693_9FIRM|nr:YidC/Oxa1 family membrane protein insertase [Anaerobacterium chartisolvens]RCX16138.1 YidC/Oxa1 family membrane protein insertase [Anaerobacterium chartisolvens]
MNILDPIAKPLGQFLYFIYNNLAFHNYGFAIIIFTIIIRLLILPLTIKQYKSSARMQELQPQIAEIQKRYKNDKEKMQQEMMKFYQDNKYNPAGGCLPVLVQMPILFSLWYVITKPFTYMLKMTHEQIYGLVENGKAIKNGLVQIFNVKATGYPEIEIIKKFTADKVGDFIGSDLSHKILDLKDGMHFLGLNLGDIPSYHIQFTWQSIGLVLIALLATATTFLSVKISMPKATQNANPQMGGMQNTMMYIAPVMTLVFSFQFPAGLGVYWTMGYIIQIFQQLYINKHVLKKKEVASK